MIDFSKIDENIRDLVMMFNGIGLETEFSCEGHDEYEPIRIIFKDSVRESDIFKVANNILSPNKYLGEFDYWLRKGLDENNNEKLLGNWMFSVSCPFESFEDRFNMIKDIEEKIKSVYNC